MSDFDRAFQLHRLLQGRRTGIPFADLERQLECRRSSVRRALSFLRDQLGAPLVYDPELCGYRYQGEGFFELPGIWFSAQELAALLVLEEVLEQQPLGLLSSTLKPLRSRLERLAAKAGVPLSDWRNRLRLLRMAARPAGSEFEIIAEALAARKRLQIDYHARGDDRMAPRIVSPQRLTLYRDNWYLDAWCHRRDALRVFALDRIIAADRLDQPAIDVQTDVLDRTLAGSYGIFAGEPTATARLRFSPRAARWIAAEIWHPQQHDERGEDGSLIRRLPFHRSEELVMDILRQGADVEVLAPAALRAEVATRLRQALAAYEIHPAVESTESTPPKRTKSGFSR